MCLLRSYSAPTAVATNPLTGTIASLKAWRLYEQSMAVSLLSLSLPLTSFLRIPLLVSYSLSLLVSIEAGTIDNFDRRLEVTGLKLIRAGNQADRSSKEMQICP